MSKCPYCDKQVTLDSTKRETKDEIHKEIQGAIKKEVMYSCPHCDSVLGFAFFIGGLITGRP